MRREARRCAAWKESGLSAAKKKGASEMREIEGKALGEDKLVAS